MKNETKDQVKLDMGFKIVCLNCGNENCIVDDDRSSGSSATGMYGSIDFKCEKCGQTETISGS